MDTDKILKKFPARRENLINILHAIQDNHTQNYLSEEALIATAQYLNLTKSAVMGVAEYYSMFSLSPRGRYIIRLCISPVCELMQGSEIKVYLENKLGIKEGQTTACQTFTFETTECLGHCATAPCLMINQEVFDGLTREKIDLLLRDFVSK
ncbi:MAG TPA: NAD(P)H-dependent oxidoreductase subunit E [Bacteroidales bacterium]|nr:NAD(P)H-dependent oxidoreductase subunit E [Bacteroidales bacterium]